MSTGHPTDGHSLDGPQDIERAAREELHQRIVEDPYRFVGPSRNEDDADPAIGPVTGDIFILVPADSPERFWEDERLRLGVCCYFPELDPAVEASPCPYKAISVLAAPTLEHLYAAAFIQTRRTHIDFSRRTAIAHLRGAFRPVRLQLNSVRMAMLLGDGDLPGGEPRLRWFANQLRAERHPQDPGWVRVRATLQGSAAMAAVDPDAGWQNAGFRLLLWTLPLVVLIELGIVRVSEVQSRPPLTRLLLARDRSHQLIVPQLIARSPEARGSVGRQTWRAARLSRRALRRRVRNVRSATRRVGAWTKRVAEEEGGWHDQDLQSRAAKRKIAFGTVRRMLTLSAAAVALIATPLGHSLSGAFEWLQRVIR